MAKVDADVVEPIATGDEARRKRSRKTRPDATPPVEGPEASDEPGPSEEPA